MSKRCELQKEYYQANGNYKGNGKYKDEYVSWLEEQILALRIHDVSGSLGFDEGYSKGYSDAQREAAQEIREHYHPNDR